MSDQVENDDDLLLDTVEEDDASDIDLDSDDEQLDDDAQPEEDDSEELEHDGQKFKIPKALKPLAMMQADYTQKTQALAEQRKAFEAETAQKQATIQQNLQDVARVVSIDQRLQQFQNLNWQAVSENDPLQAQQLMIERQQLMESRQQIVGTISQRDQQRAFEAQQQFEIARNEGLKVLERELPNWGAPLARQIMEFAQSDLGYSAQELQTITDPRIVKTLHAAMVGHRVLNKQKAGTAKAPATQPTPVKTVGKSSPATKNPERMSTDEWMKSRNQQLRKNKR
jgi:hypothetical protein